jgi:hypothetical protein
MKRVLFAAAMALLAATSVIASSGTASTEAERQAWNACFQYPEFADRDKCLQPMIEKIHRETEERTKKQLEAQNEDVRRGIQTMEANLVKTRAQRDVAADTFVLCVRDQRSMWRRSKDPSDLVATAVLYKCQAEYEQLAGFIRIIEHMPNNYFSAALLEQEAIKVIIATIVTDRASD